MQRPEPSKKKTNRHALMWATCFVDKSHTDVKQLQTRSPSGLTSSDSSETLTVDTKICDYCGCASISMCSVSTPKRRAISSKRSAATCRQETYAPRVASPALDNRLRSAAPRSSHHVSNAGSQVCSPMFSRRCRSCNQRLCPHPASHTLSPSKHVSHPVHGDED